MSLGLAVAAPAVAAPAWRPSVIARFGTTADVPSTWRADLAPGDAQRFVSPDGAASITLSGTSRGEQSAEDGFAARAKPGVGETITEQHRSPKALVIVAARPGGRIVYRKSILGCADQVWNDLVIEYPASRRAALDALVTHAAASLHQGRGTESLICRR